MKGENGLKVIKLFGASFCSGCKVMKKMLEDKMIPYEYHDIDTDEGAAEATKYNVRGLPTTVILRDDMVVRIMVGVQPMSEVESV